MLLLQDKCVFALEYSILNMHFAFLFTSCAICQKLQVQKIAKPKFIHNEIWRLFIIFAQLTNIPTMLYITLNWLVYWRLQVANQKIFWIINDEAIRYAFQLLLEFTFNGLFTLFCCSGGLIICLAPAIWLLFSTKNTLKVTKDIMKSNQQHSTMVSFINTNERKIPCFHQRLSSFWQNATCSAK